ncbi:MAG: SDR family oxidoreductase [Acidimicrobiia bacterium]|nr:SDR family oxidoreductase [Acidimicrobiia bacterium]
MTTDELAGQIAIVTGGGSGIGAATAEALARRGVHCVLVGRREDRLVAVEQRLATPASHLAADLTDDDAPARIVERARTTHGRLDMIVHAAGVFDRRPLGETDTDFWQPILDLNLTATMALTRESWADLGESQGQVVLVSSAAALRGFPDNAAYAASKGGMNALGEVLREEGRALGIRVLTVCPAQTDTELWDDQAPDEVRARMMSAPGVGRLIAALVASDRSIDFAPIAISPPIDPWTSGS